jgi:hypothetical protein
MFSSENKLWKVKTDQPKELNRRHKPTFSTVSAVISVLGADGSHTTFGVRLGLQLRDKLRHRILDDNFYILFRAM